MAAAAAAVDELKEKTAEYRKLARGVMLEKKPAELQTYLSVVVNGKLKSGHTRVKSAKEAVSHKRVREWLHAEVERLNLPLAQYMAKLENKQHMNACNTVIQQLLAEIRNTGKVPGPVTRPSEAHGQGVASAPESAEGAGTAGVSFSSSKKPPQAAASASHSAVTHGQGSNASVPESTLLADGEAAAAGSPPDAANSASHSAAAHGQGSNASAPASTLPADGVAATHLRRQLHKDRAQRVANVAAATSAVTQSSEGHGQGSNASVPGFREPVGGEVAVVTRFTGTALFNNDTHDGPAKTATRSKAPGDIVEHSNQAAGKGWLPFEMFEVTPPIRKELDEFRNRVEGMLSGTFETKSFQDIDVKVLQVGVESMYADDGELLMIALDVAEIWPTMDTEQLHLYDLASKILPKHNRSKDPQRTEWMHSFGVKQLGLSEKEDRSILLKMDHNNDDSPAIYSEFRHAACLFYGKQEILESLVAPDNHAVRKQLRDQLRANSCCAIPGAEELITACACSVTEGYYPNLHRDKPKKGTLECILFSGGTDAVFAAKCGNVEKIVPLKSSTLILLDSKRTWHAAQRSEKDAKAAFASQGAQNDTKSSVASGAESPTYVGSDGKDAVQPMNIDAPTAVGLVAELAALRAKAPHRDDPGYNAWEADYCAKAHKMITDGNPNDIDVCNAACDIIAHETTNDMLGKSKYVRKFIGDLYKHCTNDAMRRRGLVVIVGDAEASINQLIRFFAVQLYEDKLYALVKRIAYDTQFQLEPRHDPNDAKWAIRRCFDMIQVGYARLQVVNGRPADMFLKKLPKIPAESGFAYFRSNGPIEVVAPYGINECLVVAANNAFGGLFLTRDQLAALDKKFAVGEMQPKAFKQLVTQLTPFRLQQQKSLARSFEVFTKPEGIFIVTMVLVRDDGVIFMHAITVDRYRDVINFGMNDDADDQITLRPDGNEVTFVSCAKEGLMQHFPNLKAIDVGDVYRVQIKTARLEDVPHAALLPVPCNKRVGEGGDDGASAKRPRN